MILIGSAAAKIWFTDFREPNDKDFVCREKDYPGRNCEIDGIRHEYHSLPDNIYDVLDSLSAGGILTSDGLYTLKLSHMFWPHNWNKHVHDLIFFQQKGYCRLREYQFYKLYEYWEIRHGKKRAYLKKTNEEFFKDNVRRKYVHDDIHRAIMYYDRPLFESIKEDQKSAAVNPYLFNDLGHLNKVRLAREEIYVTALERFLIPANFQLSPVLAYRRAIKQLVTSMTKGWWPKWIMEHIREIWEPDEYNWIEKFQRALQEGKIRSLL